MNCLVGLLCSSPKGGHRDRGSDERHMGPDLEQLGVKSKGAGTSVKNFKVVIFEQLVHPY